MRQKQSVFGPGGGRIKKSVRGVHSVPAQCESSGVEISNAAVGLEKVVLNRIEPQFFTPADETGTVSDQVELEIVILLCERDSLAELRETVWSQFAIRVRKQNN